MKNLIATGLIAAGLALSPMATLPAQAADAEDLLGVIVGLGIIAAIANELDDDRKSKTTRKSYSHKPIIRNPHRGVSRHRVLPQECLLRLETRRGNVRTLAGERCLERRGVRTARLPDRCERVIETRRGLRDAFAARCLEREGYVFRR